MTLNPSTDITQQYDIVWSPKFWECWRSISPPELHPQPCPHFFYSLIYFPNFPQYFFLSFFLPPLSGLVIHLDKLRFLFQGVLQDIIHFPISFLHPGIVFSNNIVSWFLRVANMHSCFMMLLERYYIMNVPKYLNCYCCRIFLYTVRYVTVVGLIKKLNGQ